MKHLKLPDATIAVREAGHAGAPLLLVHGFPLDHTIWQPQIDYFAAHCRVIAPDLRGFGASDAVPGAMSMEQLADDLHGVLEKLNITQPVIFCGLSMGGYVGWQFWRKYRDRLAGLILCDTRAVPDTPEAAIARRKMAASVLANGPEAAAEAMMPKMFARATHHDKPELISTVREMMLRQRPEGIAAALEGLATRIDARPLLGQIDVPTLVIVGEHDAISTVDEMRAIADGIPNAGWLMVPNAGHLAPLENPTVVNDAMAEFIAPLGSGSYEQ